VKKVDNGVKWAVWSMQKCREVEFGIGNEFCN